jgi:ABC-2 type transport system permease protein
LNLTYLKASLSLFRIRTAVALQYRMAGLASASIGIVWGLIEIAVYTVFYKYADNRSAAIALNLPQMISYIWLQQALIALQPMNIDAEILKSIENGNVGVELCRPLDLYDHWFAKSAAGRVGSFWWRAIITIAVAIVLPASWGLSAPASAPGFILFICSAFAAFMLCAAYGMLMTAVQLGITWGRGPTHMLILLGSLFSGAYLPLQLWPKFLQKILYYQPFAGWMDLPLRLYIGSMRPKDAVGTIALQLGWTVVFILGGRFLMNRKLGKIIVQGG